MRISLIGNVNLPGWFEQDKKVHVWSAPVGILSIASILLQKKHKVWVQDLAYEIDAGNLIPDGTFYGSAADRILSVEPDLVGFSTMCNSFHIALRLAESVKARAPKVKIVMGGPQASMVDVELLEQFPWVDFVLRGEAETTILDFIEELESGEKEYRTDGLTWRRTSGDIYRNRNNQLMADLDLLPMPAYDLVPYGVGDSLSLEAGRGCPFSCTFCSTSTYWKRNFRVKSIPKLLEEMKILHNQRGVDFFSFRHDLFTLNQNRVREFSRALKSELPGVKWACSARLDCVSEELLKEMSASGCVAIFYGLETGSTRMQKEIKKNLNVENALKIIRASEHLDISPTVSFITGFPTEQEQDLRDTLRMIQELIPSPKTSFQLHLLGPERGTWEWDHHQDRIRFDGYFSDISGSATHLLDLDLIKKFPGLFSCFYYFESDVMPRELLRGIDLFVHGPCMVLKQTVQALLAGMELFDLFMAWQLWQLGRGTENQPYQEQKVDDYLLDFYSFVEDLVLQKGLSLDPGVTRDEILAFILEYYEETPVHWLAPGAVQTEEMTTDGGV